MEDGIIPELVEFFREHSGCVICYSGGLDSTVLLRNAIEATDDFVLMFAELPMTSKYQKETARKVALELGVQPTEVRVWWDALGDAKSNGPDRCYHCKNAIYSRARKIADNEGYQYIICGDNADDHESERPGMRAGKENGVLSPLRDLGIGRETVREAVESMCLSIHQYKDTCLATRYPQGERLTDNMLRYVEGCESIVRTVTDVGLLRVRLDSDNNATIQVAPSDIELVKKHLKEIESSFILKGIENTQIDENGYETL